MDNYGLKTLPLEQPGWLGRLLGKRIRSNAYREIHNLLAHRGVSGLSAAAVEEVVARYKISRLEAGEHLRGLYRVILFFLAADHEVSDGELEELRRLRDLFGLSGDEVRTLEAELYRHLLDESLGDRKLTDEERTRLDRIVKQLKLPDDIAQRAYAESTTTLLQKITDEMISDRRLSAEEEQDFARLAKELQVKINYDEATARTLDRFRLLWRIDQGDVPEIAAPINLRRGERCYGAIPAAHHEMRTMTRAIRYSGPSGRVRIARGVYWRMGHTNVERITVDHLALLGTGTLYITNQRLLFDGDRKSTSIALGKVINFTLHPDGLTIEKDSGKDQVFRYDNGDQEIIGSTLNAALRMAG